MTAVILQQLSRRYRETNAVDSLDLSIADKEFVVLLGPSGCGKTTTLNMIAGMDSPTAGHIFFDGEPVESVPPEKRNIAMVFQSIALYPHKSVYENIAFPLRMARAPRSEIDARVRSVANLMRIGELLNRRPHELSGGQRQRVALGRAAVRDPSVFLFDEPLSALDAGLRADMRVEIKKLHERLDATFIYVTHDQVEALTMADRIAVMNAGRLMQYGTPDEIYRRPSNTTVARFVGSPSMNLIPGHAVLAAGGWTFKGAGVSIPLDNALGTAAASYPGALTVGVRAESLMLDGGGIPFQGDGRVYAVEPLGSDQFIDASYDGGNGASGDLVKLRTRPDVRVRVGEPIAISAAPSHMYMFNADGDRIFPHEAPR
jgi:multiple sugar transport system ATP-binding protein